MLEELKERVCAANIALVQHRLVTLTWGNASAIDRERGLVVIKPSGVAYDNMSSDDMVVVDLEGNVMEGRYRPSSDTPTHLVLYKAFLSVGGIVHTHSKYATAWAQSVRPIPNLGTTHADTFHTDIPLMGEIADSRIHDAYEEATGDTIVETFCRLKITPEETPAVLAVHHGPFAWGRTVDKAVENAVVLEEVAKMAAVVQTLHWMNLGNWGRIDFSKPLELEKCEAYVMALFENAASKGFKDIDNVQLHCQLRYDAEDKIVFCPKPETMKKCVERLHVAGIEASIFVWQKEANRPETYLALWEFGFDSFGTDYPETLYKAAEILRSRVKW